MIFGSAYLYVRPEGRAVCSCNKFSRVRGSSLHSSLLCMDLVALAFSVELPPVPKSPRGLLA